MTYQYIFSIRQETEKELDRDVRDLERFLKRKRFKKITDTTLQGSIQGQTIKIPCSYIKGGKTGIYLLDKELYENHPIYNNKKIYVVETEDEKLWESIQKMTTTSIRDKRTENYFLKKIKTRYQ